MTEHRNRFFRYIIPSVISMLGVSCYVLADTVFLSHISEHAIASLNIIIPLYCFVDGIGILLSIGASTLFGISKAQGKLREGNLYFNDASYIGILVSVIAAVFLAVFARETVILFGADSETVQEARDYLVGFVIFAPFMCMNHILIEFLRNDNNPSLASFASVAGSLFNVFMDWLFIEVFDWGMMGAAVASGSSPVLGIMICLIHFIQKKNNFRFERVMPSVHRLIEICHIGLASFISKISSGLLTLIVNKQLLALGGNIALTAYGIVINVGYVINSINDGIGQGAQPLYSISYGHNDSKHMKKYLLLTAVSIIVCFTVVYGILALFLDQIIAIFNPANDELLAHLTYRGMLIYCFGYLFSGLIRMYSTYFSSVKDPLPATLISVLKAGAVIAPLVYILPTFLNIDGIWLSFPISEIIIFLVSAFCYWQRHRRLAGE